MRMQKRKFRIGELADKLNVERFVVRFWEKEFHLKTSRSNGGQRFYDENDLAKFETIKKLLYDQGYTISGAKKILEEKNVHKIIASQKTTMDSVQSYSAEIEKLKQQKELLTKQLEELKKQLLKLRTLL